MNIALVYNIKKDPQAEGTPADYYSEFDSAETIENIASAITSNGHYVTLIEADRQMVKRLLSLEPDIVFNIAEGLDGLDRESQVPAMLDFFNIPYTGSGPLSLALSLDKNISKTLFTKHSIPTPKFQLFKSADAPLSSDLIFPLIVKPSNEGSAKGITADSVVWNKTKLKEQVDRVVSSYRQDALAEEFIDGKELTVGVLGNDRFFDLPVLEVDFSACRDSGEYFYSWRMKEYQGNEEMGLTPKFFCPARLSRKATREVRRVAHNAHRLLGCTDISRVDIRLSRDDVPYVLEVNPLPGLDEKESNFPLMTKAAGIDYDRFIGIILRLAASRYGIKDAGLESKGIYSSNSATYASAAKPSLSLSAKGANHGI
ncbi:MAG: ATP-grasp domain-containing protein [Candidatus Omnitrophica bacterium]|nr:ATP-grasp domain-containing protein [Candidatus Omnitrophota bacterium]